MDDVSFRYWYLAWRSSIQGDWRASTLSDEQMKQITHNVKNGLIGYDDARRMRAIDPENPMVTRLMLDFYEVIDGPVPPDSELF